MKLIHSPTFVPILSHGMHPPGRMEECLLPWIGLTSPTWTPILLFLPSQETYTIAEISAGISQSSLKNTEFSFDRLKHKYPV